MMKENNVREYLSPGADMPNKHTDADRYLQEEVIMITLFASASCFRKSFATMHFNTGRR